MMTTTSFTSEKLVELPLGQEGLNYVRSNLENKTSFSQAVLPLVTKGGSVFAVVPEATGITRALEFERGGLVGTRLTNQWLIDRLLYSCRGHIEGVLIFDEPWGGRKGDPAVMRRSGPKFFHHKFVYHFVAAKDANQTSVHAAMSAPGGFLFIAAFSLYPFDASKVPADLTVADDQVVRDIAAQIQEIYVSAYDHESYVVWTK